MDYIITDAITSPIELAHQYTEKFAYMPNTFFVGDHSNMFSHLQSKALLDRGKDGKIRDDSAILNGVNIKTSFGPYMAKVLFSGSVSI